MTRPLKPAQNTRSEGSWSTREISFYIQKRRLYMYIFYIYVYAYIYIYDLWYTFDSVYFHSTNYFDIEGWKWDRILEERLLAFGILVSYWWWKKSCTNIYEVFYITGGAGFLPSTVGIDSQQKTVVFTIQLRVNMWKSPAWRSNKQNLR